MIKTNTFYNLLLHPRLNKGYFKNPYPNKIKVTGRHSQRLYVISVKRGCFWCPGFIMRGKDIKSYYMEA